MPAHKTINQHRFHDGKIVLYQLEGRPKQLWLCRIKVPNGPGYISRGTGTSDLYQARKFADDLLDELKYKVRAGQSVTGLNVRKMVQEYEDHAKLKGQPTRREQAIIAYLKTYAIPYFTKAKVSDLTPSEISRFFDWRRTNSKKKAPAETTIIHETSQLRTFFRWCYKRGLLGKVPEIENPKHKGTRRPAFDKGDWRKVAAIVSKWETEARTKPGSVSRDRIVLAGYVTLLSTTGIRVGEARDLRWRDIEPHKGSGRRSTLILHVKGKTGIREVVAASGSATAYLDRIKELRQRETGSQPPADEYVFCHKNGSKIHSFKKGFGLLVQQAGVERDRFGEKRTIYSLRHTYATARLHEGVNHYILARNMGTSVKMLENHYGHTSNRAMSDELTKRRERELLITTEDHTQTEATHTHQFAKPLDLKRPKTTTRKIRI